MKALAVMMLVISGCAVASQPRPAGQQGPDADALAHKMLEDVNATA